MSFLIRSLRADDARIWRSLWDDYCAFYKVTLPAAHNDALFQRLMNGAPHFALLVENEQRICGFAHVLLHASTWAASPYCYLEDLFVAPSLRGCGAGRALIEAVYDEADKRGCARVYWHTDAANRSARLLYDKLATLSDFVQYRRAQ